MLFICIQEKQRNENLTGYIFMLNRRGDGYENNVKNIETRTCVCSHIRPRSQCVRWFDDYHIAQQVNDLRTRPNLPTCHYIALPVYRLTVILGLVFEKAFRTSLLHSIWYIYYLRTRSYVCTYNMCTSQRIAYLVPCV